MMKDTIVDAEKLIHNFMFVSPLARDLLKLHCSQIANQELFDELEKMCKEHVLTKIQENDRLMKEAREKAATADNVVQRILHYHSYAQHKNAPKMRLTTKEYNQSMSLLNDEEKLKVESWLELNGGLDKYVVAGHNG